MAVRGDDGRAGGEAYVGLAGDEGGAGEALITGRVGHDEAPGGVQDGVGAEGEVAGCLGRIEPDLDLEPLAVCVDQADGRHPRPADAGSRVGDVVEDGFASGVEDSIP